MQQWIIPAFGIDSLQLVTREDTQPASLTPHQVLVRIHAISLNYRDLMVVKGLYNPRLSLPRVPCSDGAGEVVAIGTEVTEWKPGDRVAGIFMQNWQEGYPSPKSTKGALGGDINGMLSTEVVLPETGLVRIPAHLSYQEAATLPCAAVTAWKALFSATSTLPGDTVLIQGTGGVSIFALQFAKLAGASVLGTSSSDEKLAHAKLLGLDAGLNYRARPDWDKWALEQTAGAGVDLVVEVGGSGTFPLSLRAARPRGVIAQIGVLSGATEPVDVRPILTRQLRIHGVYVGSRADFVAMNKAISLASLKPVIDRVFPFAEAPAALRHMESATHFGKIVISATE
jgi:NADPH:quinone reductase-like Zn-dependent oxidoreductase